VSLRQADDILCIQYLRGLAAVSVLLFHVSETFDLGFRVGAAGVDVFFVISGFIMWVTTAGRTVSPATFMRRRIVRIVPLYWIVTLLTAICIAWKPQFFFGHDGSLSNILGSLVFLPSLKNGALHPTVIQGWTLCYEMFFYGLFALSLLWRAESRAHALVVTLFALTMLHQLMPTGYASVFTEPILLEFAMGILLGVAWCERRSVPFPLALAAIAAGAIWLILDNIEPVSGARTIRWGIPATLLVAGALSLEQRTSMPRSQVLHFLGDASYSIYLWHALLATLATGVVLRVDLPTEYLPLAVGLLTLASSLIAYALVERPLNRHLQARSGKSTRIGAIS